MFHSSSPITEHLLFVQTVPHLAVYCSLDYRCRLVYLYITTTMTTTPTIAAAILLLLIQLVSIEAFHPSASASRSSTTTSTNSAKALLLPLTATALSTRAVERKHAHVLYARGQRGGSDNNDRRRGPEQQYLATCIPGCAAILAKELESDQIRCWNVQVSGNAGVQFSADTETALRALLWARTAHKMMELMCTSGGSDDGSGMIQNRDDLFAFVKQRVDVRDLLGDGRGGLLTLSVQTILNSAHRIPADINHSHYTALTIKNALADSVRDLRGDRPNVDLDDPDVPLVAVLLGTDDGAVVSLYRQLHPTGSLHRRGYRSGSAIHKAAMKESMAAAVLLHAGWPEQCRRALSNSNKTPVTLLDPMAGSGSLLLEAACIAGNVAPGLMRIKCGLPGHSMPPVTRWKAAANANSGPTVVDIWKDLLLEATVSAKQGLQRMQSDDCPIEIIGNDIHPAACDLFESGLRQAGLERVIQVTEGDCLDWVPQVRNPDSPWFIVSNPPWDVRLTGDMHTAWEAMRVFLRETVPSCTEAWVLSGNAAATKHLGLRKSPGNTLSLKTGEQDLRWIQYLIRDKNAPVEVREDRRKDRAHDADTDARELVASPTPTRRSPALSAKRRIEDADNAWLID
jgi:23S rRNA G2445 N2-methylase RlmL